MKRVLFGLNQNSSRAIEEGIKTNYVDATGESFEFDCEYYLAGVWKSLTEREYDVLILKEDLEGNTVEIDYLDDITDKFPNINIIYVINNEHERDNYVRQLFNLGIYNILYKDDFKLSIIVDLIQKQRSKMDAKIYLDIEEVDSVDGETNLEIINDRELDTMLLNLKESSLENVSAIFDEISNSYNDKQLLFLITVIPKDIQDKLSRSGNESYDKYYKRWLILGDKYSAEVTTKYKPTKESGKTKTITKIEKEYVHSIPSDYNKIVGFVGCRQVGTTTIVDLVAKEFVKKGKKVTVLDFTNNKTFYYMKCWGDTEITNKEKRSLEYINKGEDYPIIVGDNYKLYTQVEGEDEYNLDNELNFFQIIEQIRYDNDIILIDMDFSTPCEWLKYGVTSLYVVNDLNILNMYTVKEYIRKIINKGVNKKKISLIVNKNIKSKVKPEDILSCITQPIPYIESESSTTSIDINKEIFKIDFEMDSYAKLISSYLFVNEEVIVSRQIEDQILSICQHIYPLSKGDKKGLGDKLKKLISLKK